VLTVVSHAWHSWKGAKAVALFAIVALAFGIGSTTAIYTVVHGVMLAPLPYANGDRFVALVTVTAGAWLLTRYFEALELGWMPFAFAAAIVAGTSVVASSFPAWRASRIQPIVAIRDGA
jgi:ABC-type lipoprotein release transport system permease subunit